MFTSGLFFALWGQPLNATAVARLPGKLSSARRGGAVRDRDRDGPATLAGLRAAGTRAFCKADQP